MNHLLVLAGFILLSTGSSAATQSPGTEAHSAPSESSNVPAEAHHAADSRARGTRESPVAVELVAVPGATDDDKRKHAERVASERTLERLTLALAIATFGLVFATFLLWYATRRLVLDAGANAERQLRAYVGVESGSVHYAICAHPVAAVTLKNYGNTPAYKFTINSGIGMASAFGALPPPLSEEPGGPRGVLSPGATAVLARNGPVPITSGHLEALRSGQSTLFVYGEVRYTDAFKKPRVLTYRMMNNGDSSLASCEKGNDAD